jgi:ABC-type transporter Mla subunit MlaD
MEATNRMASSANVAITSLDQFVRQFGAQPGQVSPIQSSPQASDSRPFDVREYGASAAQIGEAAQKLDTLIKSLDQAAPRVDAILARSAEESKKVIDHAFRMALALALITLACVVAAMLTYRIVASRIPGNKRT